VSRPPGVVSESEVGGSDHFYLDLVSVSVCLFYPTHLPCPSSRSVYLPVLQKLTGDRCNPSIGHLPYGRLAMPFAGLGLQA